MIESRPPRAAILFAGARMLQLPTPTPGAPMPEISITDAERFADMLFSRSQELNWQQMIFIGFMTVMIVVGIYGVYLIRRANNKPKAEQTVAETAAELVTAARLDADRTQQRMIEQNDKFIETAVVMSDAVMQNADNGKQLNSIVDRLSTHVEQLAGRQNERDKKLESMSSALDTMVQQGSEPLRKLIAMAETMLAAANEIKETAVRIECKQSELQKAIDAIRQTEQTLNAIKEDTGNVATVSELDADAKPADEAAA
jgi:methyl-accepting chemotaxis protein